MVPFTVKIPEEERDRDFPKKLRPELPGILAWAVRGCLAWQREGLETPGEVRDTTREYRDRQDPFGRFLAEVCDLKGGDVQASSLHTAYEIWCRVNKEKSLSTKELSEEMLERGFQKKKSDKNYYRGLALK